AKLLGCKVILISSGGIGRPIDEIILNRALFEKQGVKLLGVIINKVLPAKFNKINNLVRKGLARSGIKVLGVIPYSPMLSYPTIEQILGETNFEILSGKEYLEQYISSIIVGAMEPCEAVKYITNGTLLITPGDRQDMIMSALGCFREKEENRLKAAGIILSGGLLPDNSIVDLLRKAQIPVLLAKADTYGVATTIHDLTVKMRPRDTTKISTAVNLIKDNVDLEAIAQGI
ncbi:MAG: DRTGG domain-containing protein, partial [Candidatus Omnitrophota bacterium]